jgi:hypothetical protein
MGIPGRLHFLKRDHVRETGRNVLQVVEGDHGLVHDLAVLRHLLAP